ncbi:MAG: DUF3822 family protein [Bacteroidales bacterium]
MTDKILDFTKSEQYSLSIRLRPDGFSFYVTNPNQFKMCFEKHILLPGTGNYVEEIKKAIFAESHLLLPYRNVTILMEVSGYQLVPDCFFDRDTVEELFYTGRIPLTDKKIMINHLRRNQYHLLFDMDADLFSFLTRTFGINRVYAHISPLLEYYCKKSRSTSSGMFVHVNDNGADISAYSDGKLQISVSHRIEELNDYLFHILSVWETLGFNQETDDLFICGENPHFNELNSLLKRYIHKVSKMSGPISLTLKEENSIPLEIQTLPLCEL